jgi:CHAD domain-containing protein
VLLTDDGRMTTISHEHETTYDVDSDFSVPDLAGLSPRIDHIAECDHVALRSRYYDTAEFDLLQARVTLRLRTGTVDAGWQLTLPDGDIRTEILLPAQTPAQVPATLADVVRGIIRAAPLVEIVDLRIVRDWQKLVSADGVTLVTVSDDTVAAASGTGGAALDHWREIEVTAGPDDDSVLLKAVIEQIAQAGGSRSAAWSKLVRAVARLDVAPVTDTHTAGELVLGYLAAQRNSLLHSDVALRGGLRATHDARVATRRIRSTLRVFGDVFKADRVAQLDSDLRWLAGELGSARDAEVAAERLKADLADIAPYLVFGGPAALGKRLDDEARRCAEETLKVLGSARYAAVLDDLTRFVDMPPYTSMANKPASAVAGYVAEAIRTLERRLTIAESPHATVASLHRVRKAAKRARYAVELGKPVLGKKFGRRELRRMTALHERLGEVQDAAIAQAAVYRLAGAVPGETGTGFTYGLLYERERGEAERHRQSALNGDD